MNKFKLIFATCILCFMNYPAFSGTTSTASDLLKELEDIGVYQQAREGNKNAIRQVHAKANSGLVSAQVALGEMYEYGNGVKQDYKKAISWYLKAAKQGAADAQTSLGLLYFSGKGVAKDFGYAFEWYKKASDQGDAFGQYLLGRMYLEGQGTSQNYEYALQMIEKSAEEGWPQAQFHLAFIYSDGKITSKNNVLAYKWAAIDKSRQNSNSEYFDVDSALINKLEKYMSRDEIQQAQAQAAEWLEKFNKKNPKLPSELLLH